MAKFVIIFLITFFVAITSGHSHPHIVSSYVEEGPVHTITHVDQIEDVPHIDENDYTEIYVSLAQAAFDFLAKFIRTKVDWVLWIKRAFVTGIVRLAVQLKHWVAEYGVTVGGVVTTVTEVMKVFGVPEEAHAVDDVPHY